MSDDPVIANPWHALRQFTAARIALGRTGVSQPTGAQLAFQLAHARARDAVHQELDAPALVQALEQSFDPPLALPVMALCSAAENRTTYLQRPDLGRKLDTVSRQSLRDLSQANRPVSAPGDLPYDLAIVIADGLSALAIGQNAVPFLQRLMARLALEKWVLAPITIVRQGRVAIGDEIGQLLGARAVVVLIGERPGLSSPDSMGLYLTWAPRTGLTDASRNCISNVRPAGLGYDAAAFRLHYLLTQSRQRQLSGIALKDETPGTVQLEVANAKFLL
jgi:ethanolamine ammonia-lyase small subunit